MKNQLKITAMLVLLLSLFTTSLFCTGTNSEQGNNSSTLLYNERPVLIHEQEFASRVHYIRVSDSILIIGLADSIVGLQADSFQKLWIIPFSNIWIWQPCIGTDILHASGKNQEANDENTIISVDINTGETIAQWDVPDQFTAPILLDSILMYGQRLEGIRTILNSSHTLWQIEIEGWWPRVLSASEEVVIAACRKSGNSWINGTTPTCEAIFGLSMATGEQLWFRELTDFKVNRLLINSGNVFVPFADSLIAIDINSGEIVWNIDVNLIQRLAHQHDTLLTIGEDEILQLDARTGEIYRSDYLRGWSNAMPVFSEETLFLRNAGRIMCLSYPDIIPMWAISLDCHGTFLVRENRLYCSSRNGFYVFEFQNQ